MTHSHRHMLYRLQFIKSWVVKLSLESKRKVIT